MIQIGAAPERIDSPVDHLIACHRRIEQRFDTISRALTRLDADPDAALSAIANSIRFLDTSGALHTRDEEDSLFPRILPRLSSAERDFIASLRSEHDRADLLFAEVKRRAPSLPEHADEFARAAEELTALYTAHIQAEDSTLMELARRLLTSDESAAIAHEMRKRRA